MYVLDILDARNREFMFIIVGMQGTGKCMFMIDGMSGVGKFTFMID